MAGGGGAPAGCGTGAPAGIGRGAAPPPGPSNAISRKVNPGVEGLGSGAASAGIAVLGVRGGAGSAGGAGGGTARTPSWIDMGEPFKSVASLHGDASREAIRIVPSWENYLLGPPDTQMSSLPATERTQRELPDESSRLHTSPCWWRRAATAQPRASHATRMDAIRRLSTRRRHGQRVSMICMSTRVGPLAGTKAVTRK